MFEIDIVFRDKDNNILYCSDCDKPAIHILPMFDEIGEELLDEFGETKYRFSCKMH